VTPSAARDAGAAALGRSDWHAAVDAFASALRLDDSPDARLGLGSAHMWRDEMAAAVRSFEQAYLRSPIACTSAGAPSNTMSRAFSPSSVWNRAEAAVFASR
jgi:hypothetical protein